MWNLVVDAFLFPHRSSCNKLSKDQTASTVTLSLWRIITISKKCWLFDLAGPKCTYAECSKHVASHHKLQAPHKHDSGVQLYTEVLCKTVTGTSHIQKSTNKNCQRTEMKFLLASLFLLQINHNMDIFENAFGRLVEWLVSFCCYDMIVLVCLRSMSGIRVWFVYSMIFAYLRSCVCVCACVLLWRRCTFLGSKALEFK